MNLIRIGVQAISYHATSPHFGIEVYGTLLGICSSDIDNSSLASRLAYSCPALTSSLKLRKLALGNGGDSEAVAVVDFVELSPA